MMTEAEHAHGFTHKPALDGLRAVAVGSVMAFHFGATWALGGFLGVDTFFVLSGYLITSLLITEWGRTGTVRFAAFWGRRARRLLPALLVVLAAIAIWAHFEADSARFGAIRGDSLWTLFYSANWHLISSQQSYFDLFSEPSPLRHAWSLAIEEQFYLVWPLVAYVCLRLGRGRTHVLTGLCIAGTAASVLLLGHFYNATDPSRAYYGTDTRASQLLVGALLAVILVRWAPRTGVGRAGVQVLGVVGAGVTIWAFAAARDQDSWLYHGGFLVFAIATAALIAAIVQPGPSPLKAVLSFGPARWIGQISYGLYLWHWPVVVALSEPRTRLSGWDLGLLRLGVTFAAATLSYYLIELPIRRKRALINWHARVAAPIGIGVTAALILVATAGATAPSTIFAAPPGKVTHATAPTTIATIPTAAAPIPTRWVLVGDSVAGSVSVALPSFAAKQGISFSAATRSGCPMTTSAPVAASGAALPWIPNCVRRTAGYETEAVTSSRAQVVVWLSSWEMSDHLVNGKVVRFNTLAGNALLESELNAALARFHAAGASKLVLLTNPPPASHSDEVVPSVPARTLPPKLNRLFRQFASKHPSDVMVVDLASIVCPGGWPCPEYVDGIRPRPQKVATAAP